MKSLKVKETIIYRGVLAILDKVKDSFGESFATNCEVKIAKAIFVELEFNGRAIGTAKVFKRKKKVYYHIAVDTQEVPKPYAQVLVPVIGGVVHARKGNVLTKILINKIGLTTAPSDKRLKPLLIKGVR